MGQIAYDGANPCLEFADVFQVVHLLPGQNETVLCQIFAQRQIATAVVADGANERLISLNDLTIGILVAVPAKLNQFSIGCRMQVDRIRRFHRKLGVIGSSGDKVKGPRGLQEKTTDGSTSEADSKRNDKRGGNLNGRDLLQLLPAANQCVKQQDDEKWPETNQGGKERTIQCNLLK